jgi:biotin transport system substrate-specific component
MYYAKTLAYEQKASSSFTRDLLLVLLTSIGIGLAGAIAIPLPFSPVPLAIQGSLILLSAVFLGPKRAAAAVFLFLTQGAMGLPVFAGAVGGVAKFFGPTGGYLIGYLIAAYTTGTILEKWQGRTLTQAFLAMAAGTAILYLFGASYLSLFLGWKKALLVGVAPFIIGDFLKTLMALQTLRWVGWNK